MSSYNRFHNNCYRDAIIVALTNCGTSVFAGFVIFSVVGFMAHELDLPVGNVTASGPGLAFVAYPEGLSRMPAAPFWSVMFFFMLITLGLDSMFATLETVLSSLVDEFPHPLREWKITMTFVACVIGFLLGLPQVTQGGIYIMNLMDEYCASFPLLIVATCEIVVIMHVYGYSRFVKDIESMIGITPGLYWKICWNFVTPILIFGLIIFNSVNYTRLKYNDELYPRWAEVLGWLMALASVIWIPGFMIYKWAQYVGSYQNLKYYLTFPWTGETFQKLIAPSPEWGPALKKHWRPNDQEAQGEEEARINKSRQDFENPTIDMDLYNSPSVMYESHI